MVLGSWSTVLNSVVTMGNLTLFKMYDDCGMRRFERSTRNGAISGGFLGVRRVHRYVEVGDGGRGVGGVEGSIHWKVIFFSRDDWPEVLYV